MYYRITFGPAENFSQPTVLREEFECNCDEVAIEHSEKLATARIFQRPECRGSCKAVPLLLESWGENEFEPTTIKEW